MRKLFPQNLVTLKEEKILIVQSTTLKKLNLMNRMLERKIID